MTSESDRDGADPADADREHNARYAMVLFLVYVILYGGFVGLSAFAPHLMAMSPLGGVNLAILYGLGLIVAAFVLALVYTVLCRGGGK
jgi:uncharacterized membrane protein (DUF485 family)